MKPHVSDHAVIRYLERVRGMDIEAVRREILTEQLVTIAETLGGSGKYPIDRDVVAVMENNVIKTILI